MSVRDSKIVFEDFFQPVSDESSRQSGSIVTTTASVWVLTYTCSALRISARRYGDTTGPRGTYAIALSGHGNFRSSI